MCPSSLLFRLHILNMDIYYFSLYIYVSIHALIVCLYYFDCILNLFKLNMYIDLGYLNYIFKLNI